MATLQEIYDLATGTPTLELRFRGARLQAAWDVINEDPGTANHTNRLAWAESITKDVDVRSKEEFARFLSNTTIQTNGDSSTDNDIQFTVNGFVDTWANELAGP